MRNKAFTALATALTILLIVATPSTGAVTYTISVQTDAGSYSGAQTLRASGAVSPPPGPGTAVFLKIVNPSGTPVAVSSVPVNGSTGSYQHSFVLGGSSNWVAGTYTVNASWGNTATGLAISMTASFAYTPVVSATTSSTSTTTTSTTSSSTSQTSTTTFSSTSTTQATSTSSSTSQTSTTSSSTTTSSKSSSSTTNTQTTTSSSTQGGGIPEFPFQVLATTLFTFLMAASYLLARRYAMPGSKMRGP